MSNEVSLPTLTMPTSNGEVNGVVVVFDVTNNGGIDKPFQVVHQKPVSSPDGEGMLLLTVLYRHPETKEVLGSFTADFPYSIDVGDGTRAGFMDLARMMPADGISGFWNGLVDGAMAQCCNQALIQVGSTLLEELSGSADDATQTEWAKANCPTPEVGNPETGIEWMLAQVAAKRKAVAISDALS